MLNQYITTDIGTLKKANCRPLANTLNVDFLFWHETTGCEVSGGDYRFIAIKRQAGVSAYNYGGGYFTNLSSNVSNLMAADLFIR